MTRLLLSLLITMPFLAGCATTGGADPDALPAATTAEFCGDVQRLMTDSTVASTNVAYDDLAAFIESKASISPLTARQYVHPEPGSESRPGVISCKLKTADQIVFEYGEGTAGTEGTCVEMNRRIVEAVTGDRNQTAVILEDDIVMQAGTEWLKPYEMTWRDESGTLHVQSKGLRIDWADKRFAKAPPRFRGNHYCHLIAPEYLARLLSNEATTGVAGTDASDIVSRFTGSEADGINQ